MRTTTTVGVYVWLHAVLRQRDSSAFYPSYTYKLYNLRVRQDHDADDAYKAINTGIATPIYTASESISGHGAAVLPSFDAFSYGMLAFSLFADTKPYADLMLVHPPLRWQ